jgi:hypothetical protein
MYDAMMCESAGAYAGFYNPGEGRKSKKSWRRTAGSMFKVYRRERDF